MPSTPGQPDGSTPAPATAGAYPGGHVPSRPRWCTQDGADLSHTDLPRRTDLPIDPSEPSEPSGVLMPSGGGVPRDPGERAAVDALLQAAGRGDRPAFEQLYRRTSARIFGLAHAMLRNVTAAEDVTQDVYLHIWRRASHFDSTRSPALPWMLMIAHGRAVDHVRRSERLRANDAQAPLLTEAGPAFDEVVEQVLRNDPDVVLRRALDELTDLQREALHLVYWREFSGAEASQILGIPLPTFKSRLRGALTALRSASSDVAEDRVIDRS